MPPNPCLPASVPPSGDQPSTRRCPAGYHPPLAPGSRGGAAERQRHPRHDSGRCQGRGRAGGCVSYRTLSTGNGHAPGAYIAGLLGCLQLLLTTHPQAQPPTPPHAGRKERYGGTEFGGSADQFLVEKTKLDVVIARWGTGNCAWMCSKIASSCRRASQRPRGLRHSF
jgi:hypothetical protein